MLENQGHATSSYTDPNKGSDSAEGKKQLYQQENEHQVEGARHNPAQSREVSETEEDVMAGGEQAENDRSTTRVGGTLVDAPRNAGEVSSEEKRRRETGDYPLDQVAGWQPMRDLDRPTEEIRSFTQGIDGRSGADMPVPDDEKDEDRKGKNPDEWETKEEEEAIRTRIKGDVSDIPDGRGETGPEEEVSPDISPKLDAGTDADDADKTASGFDEALTDPLPPIEKPPVL